MRPRAAIGRQESARLCRPLNCSVGARRNLELRPAIGSSGFRKRLRSYSLGSFEGIESLQVCSRQHGSDKHFNRAFVLPIDLYDVRKSRFKTKIATFPSCGFMVPATSIYGTWPKLDTSYVGDSTSKLRTEPRAY